VNGSVPDSTACGRVVGGVRAPATSVGVVVPGLVVVGVAGATVVVVVGGAGATVVGSLAPGLSYCCSFGVAQAAAQKPATATDMASTIAIDLRLFIIPLSHS
jgi:hypothetical protein